MSFDMGSSKCGQQREAEAKPSTLRWAAEALNCCVDMFMLSTHCDSLCILQILFPYYVMRCCNSRQSHDDY